MCVEGGVGEVWLTCIYVRLTLEPMMTEAMALDGGGVLGRVGLRPQALETFII